MLEDIPSRGLSSEVRTEATGRLLRLPGPACLPGALLMLIP